MGAKVIDITGKTFGGLFVIERDANRSGYFWMCRCLKCGLVYSVRADSVKLSRDGCYRCGKEKLHKPRVDLSGRVFGYLTVKRLSKRRSKAGSILWKCKCRCSKIVHVHTGSLKSKHVRSCGCLHREKAAEQAYAIGIANKTHGMTRSREYECWSRMLDRCFDKTKLAYVNYGKRGVTVCDRWKDFTLFYEDMGPRPGTEYSIDRINNDGNYEPGNCRWATQLQQQRNRRSNVKITYDGRTQCISEWAEEYGMPMGLVWERIQKMGWNVHDALHLPVAHHIKTKKEYHPLRTR